MDENDWLGLPAGPALMVALPWRKTSPLSVCVRAVVALLFAPPALLRKVTMMPPPSVVVPV
jgi:hypothetical protein